MTYGMPGFKLEKHVVTRRVRRLEEAGIRFHLNFEVGRDSTLEELRNRHDALLIATGVYNSRDMEVPGVGNTGVVKALDYLIEYTRKGFADAVHAFKAVPPHPAGQHTLGIGGRANPRDSG